MRPQLPEDDVSQYVDVLKRLKRLESATSVRRKAFNVTGAANVDLGAIDGENITGVRISLYGTIGGGSFAGGSHFLRLQPNGATSIQANMVARYANTSGGAYAAVAGALSFGAVAPFPGLWLGLTDWGTNINAVSFDGVFFTKTGTSKPRLLQGSYTNADESTDTSHIVGGAISAQWYDGYTPVSSLVVHADAGSFTGAVSIETIP